MNAVLLKEKNEVSSSPTLKILRLSFHSKIGSPFISDANKDRHLLFLMLEAQKWPLHEKTFDAIFCPILS